MLIAVAALVFFVVVWVVATSNPTNKARYSYPLPPQAGLEREFQTKLAIAKAHQRWERKDRFAAVIPYLSSHGPFDPQILTCVTCGFSLLEIDQNRWYCSREKGKPGLSLTEAFMRYEDGVPTNQS